MGNNQKIIAQHDEIPEAIIVDSNALKPTEPNSNPLVEVEIHEDPKIFVDDGEKVRLRLKLGADPNIKNEDGLTPLLNCLTKNFEFKEQIITELLKSPLTDINVVDSASNTALNLCIQSDIFPIANLLLQDSRIKPDIPNDANRTPLFYATLEGNLEILGLLLSSPKVDVNYQDQYGYTALSYRLRDESENIEIVKLFLKNKKLNINLANNNNNTALHLAQISGDKESVIAILKDKRTNPSLKNNKNETIKTLTNDIDVLRILAGEST